MTRSQANDVAEKEGAEERKELPPSKWRPGCLTYSITLLLLLVIVGWVTNWFWTKSEKSALDAQIQAMQDRGEPVWFADLKPTPSSADQDGVRLFQAAAAAYENSARQNPVWASFEQTHQAGTGVGGQSLTSAYSAADIANFRQVLTSAAPTLQLLQQSLDHGTVHWPHDFQTQVPFALLLGDVQKQRGLSRILKAQGIVAIVDGDTDAAIRSIRDLFRLSDLTRDEPFLVSYLVRIAVAGQAVTLATGVLESHSLSAQQRQELDSALQQAETNYSLRQCYIAERAAMLTTVASIQDSNDLSVFSGLTDSEGVGAWLYAQLPALQYRDMAKAIEISNRTIASIDDTGPEATAQLEQIEQEITALSGTYLMTKLTLPATTVVRRANLRFRQQLRGLRIAVRVDEAFKQTGQMPAALSEIIDDSMPEIPLGTFSNLRPVFRPTKSGFQIYDVGTNGTDDGGGGDKDEADSLIEIYYPPLDPAPAGTFQPNPSGCV